MGYGNCVYVSKLAKDPALTFEWLDTLASQPNEFIKAGLFQPRKTLSNGSVALDQALGQHGAQAGGQQIRLHAHINHPDYGAGCVIGVEGGKHEVAR